MIGTEIRYPDISWVHEDSSNPRKRFDDAGIQELAESIKEVGILQPLLVRSVADKDYVIVFGHRRYRAAKLAGLTNIPCIVTNDSDRGKTALRRLIENDQREDLTPLERAKAYKEYVDTYNVTQAELAKVLGRSEARVSQCIKIAELPDEIQGFFHEATDDDGFILSASHSEILRKLKDGAKIVKFATQAFEKKMGKRELDDLVTEELAGKQTKRKKEKPEAIQDAEVWLQNVLSERGIPSEGVTIKTKANGKAVVGIEVDTEGIKKSLSAVFGEVYEDTAEAQDLEADEPQDADTVEETPDEVHAVYEPFDVEDYDISYAIDGQNAEIDDKTLAKLERAIRRNTAKFSSAETEEEHGEEVVYATYRWRGESYLVKFMKKNEEEQTDE